MVIDRRLHVVGGFVVIVGIVFSLGITYSFLLFVFISVISVLYVYQHREHERRLRLTAELHYRRSPIFDSSTSNQEMKTYVKQLSENVSPWGASVSPKSKFAGNKGIKNVQIAAGPLLSTPTANRFMFGNFDNRLADSQLFSNIPSRLFLTAQRRYPTHQSNYSGVGMFPLVRLHKSSRPILSELNTSMIKSPVTVKIAPPDSSTPTSAILNRLSKSSEKSDNPCDPQMIVNALKESRKRKELNESPLLLDNDPKRQRNNSTSSSGSALMLSETSLPNGLNLRVIDGRTLKRPAIHLDLNNDYSSNRLKKNKNNEISSSYSSSRLNFTKQSLKEKNDKVKRKRSDSNASIYARKSIRLPDEFDDNIANLPKDNKQKNMGRFSPDTQTPKNGENNYSHLDSDGDHIMAESAAKTPNLSQTLKDGFSKKQLLSLYANLQTPQPKISPPRVPSYMPTLEDYETDRKAENLRLQKILNNVNKAFMAKTEKEKQQSQENDVAVSAFTFSTSDTVSSNTVPESLASSLTSTKIPNFNLGSTTSAGSQTPSIAVTDATSSISKTTSSGIGSIMSYSIGSTISSDSKSSTPSSITLPSIPLSSTSQTLGIVTPVITRPLVSTISTTNNQVCPTLTSTSSAPSLSLSNSSSNLTPAFSFTNISTSNVPISSTTVPSSSSFQFGLSAVTSAQSPITSATKNISSDLTFKPIVTQTITNTNSGFTFGQTNIGISNSTVASNAGVFNVSSSTTSTTTSFAPLNSITTSAPTSFSQSNFNFGLSATTSSITSTSSSQPIFSFGVGSSNNTSSTNSSNIFGNSNSLSTTAVSGSIFGNTTTDQFSGLKNTSLNSSNSVPQNISNSTGLFGSAVTTQSNNIFGTSTQSTSIPNVFGSSTTQNNIFSPIVPQNKSISDGTITSQSNNVFGTASTKKGSILSNTSTNNIFGNANQNSNMFGNSTASSGNLFSVPSTNMFNVNPEPNKMFGSIPQTNTMFGSNSGTNTTFQFGAMNNPTTGNLSFGNPSSQSTPSFGNALVGNTGNAFGQQQTPSFNSSFGTDQAMTNGGNQAFNTQTGIVSQNAMSGNTAGFSFASNPTMSSDGGFDFKSSFGSKPVFNFGTSQAANTFNPSLPQPLGGSNFASPAVVSSFSVGSGSNASRSRPNTRARRNRLRR